MNHLNGVGIGLRRAHYGALLVTTRQLDWLEFVPENFVFQGGYRQRALSSCGEKYALVPHGVSLSVGGPDPLDRKYLTALKELLRRTGCPYVSDHLCFSSARGHAFHDLLPLPFSEAAVRHTAARARAISEHLELPLLLENITYYAEMPGAEMSEGAFVSAVLAESGADLLLDVNNLYLNAINHGRLPEEVLNALPLEKTRQIHLAGHIPDGDLLLDNHGTPVSEAVWDLYRSVLRRLGPIPTLLEWDTDIPDLDRVLDEADIARSIMNSVAMESIPARQAP